MSDEKMQSAGESDSKAESDNNTNKKKLREDIRNLMEFYFSDSNLSKDRFLKQEIASSADGFIDIGIFLKFNKIRLLKCTQKDIAKSLKHSDFLELNEAKTMIKRKVPFEEPSKKQTDKRTIYVENFESKVSNDSLKKYFEKFGKIAYISLPKFKTTNSSKGFAFIEYAEKDDAKKAVEFFKSRMSENEQVGKFPKTNAQINELEKKIKKLQETIDFETKEELIENISTSKLAGKRCNTDSIVAETVKSKQKKNEEHSNSLDQFANLRVISKKNWLLLREEFLQKQKDEINQLKSKLCELTKQVDDLKARNLKTKNSNIKTDDINKGCIIKVLLDLNKQSDFDLVKLTRNQFKELKLSKFLDQVVYVDLEKNSNKIYLRCKSDELAQTLISNPEFLNEFSDKSILRGKEEADYLEKIFANRNKKQEKMLKKKEILVSKSESSDNKEKKSENKPSTSSSSSSTIKHIIFDDA